MASSSTASSPFLYSCIATGTNVLVHASRDSTTAVKGAEEVAATVLKRMTPTHSSTKCTYTANGCHVHTKTFHSTLLTTPLVLILVTTEHMPKAAAYNFIEEAEKQFLQRFTLHRVQTARAGDLETEFGVTLKKLMGEYGNTKDIAREVRGELDNVKGIMSQNIERVMERGDRIELLVDKTNNLEVNANEFRRRSKGVNRQMWWKNVKINFLLGFVVLFLIYIFIGFGCGLPGWSKCLS